jgi:hypothetical protein
VTVYWNGQAAGTTITHDVAPQGDTGHSKVRYSSTVSVTLRPRFTIRCECGKRFSSGASFARAGYAHEAHVRKMVG